MTTAEFIAKHPYADPLGKRDGGIEYDAFWLMRNIYDAMNYPALPLEESLSHWREKSILQNAMCWINGGTETQWMRFRGKLTPQYPSSIEDTDL